MASLELGIIGNCTISALIDRMGTVVWSCFPRFDGDPLFCKLLDDEGERGFYSVELDDLAEVEQSYLPNTAVLVTRLTDGSGDGVEISDFAPRFQPAADPQRAADLPARGDAVHPGGRDRPAARPRRIAARAGAGDRAGVPRADDRLLALAHHAAVRAVRVAGTGDPRRHHAPALQLRGDRRDRGGDDHVDPRDPWP